MRRLLLRLLLFLLVQAAALEAGARLFTAWDDGRTFPLSPFTARHEKLVRDMIGAAGDTYYLRLHPETGWAPARDYRVRSDDPWDLYATNSAGMRGTTEFALHPPPGVARIALLGDSFTHGDDVRDSDCYPAILSRLLGPTCEVMNLGVPGFGPDQALLRHRTLGRAFHPDVALLALTDENAARLLTVFRPFYAFHHFEQDDLIFPKPRFRLADGRLNLIPSPVRTVADLANLLDPAFRAALGREDDYYRRNPLVSPPLPARLSRLVHVGLTALVKVNRFGEEAHRAFARESTPLLLALVSAFAADCSETGTRFGVLLLTERSELERARTKNYRSQLRIALLAHLRAQGIPHLELDDAFAAALSGRHAEYLIPGHYSPEGNAVVARAVRDWLPASGLLPPAAPAAAEPGKD